MPGVVQHTRESLRKEVHAARRPRRSRGRCCSACPRRRTRCGSAPTHPTASCRWHCATCATRSATTLVLIADDLPRRVHRPRPLRHRSRADGSVDNDATLERYASIAVAQAAAGADIVAPSGMMDGQVGAIRAALDAAGHARRRRSSPTRRSTHRRCTGRSATPPSAPRSFGDRRGYQMDSANAREAIDRGPRSTSPKAPTCVMVKPALAYLDVIAAVRAALAAGRRVSRERRIRDGARPRREPAGSTARPWRSSTSLAIKRAGADIDPHATSRARSPSSSGPDDACTPTSCSTARQRVIPGGVNSPVRAFASVGGEPFFVARGEGAYIVDAEGRALRRLRAVVGRVDPGARSPARDRGGAARRGRGHHVRRADRDARSSSPR